MLASYKNCSGCGICKASCYHNAIQMKENEDGFLVPIIDESLCVRCGRCERLCPVLCKLATFEFEQKVYIACNNDRSVVKKSSSGGLFFELANYVITNNGVVYGAAWGKELSVNHIRIDSKNDVQRLLKSKYVQSNINEMIPQIKNDINNGLLILFSGTPCQVAAIRKYFGYNYKKLICVDIVCHGVPNKRFFNDFICYFEKRKKDKVQLYCFREKNKYIGSYATRIVGQKRQYIKTWRSLSYSYLFMNGFIFRESCYNCQYACKERVGDISLGDFWGAKRYHSAFDTDYGASMVMVNTDNGEWLFNKIETEICYEVSKYEYAAANNAQIVHPFSRPAERDQLFHEWNFGGYDAVYHFYKSKVKGIWKDTLKNIMANAFKY